MNEKKLVLIIIFIILVGSFLSSSQKEFSNNNAFSNIILNKRLMDFTKINSLLLPLGFNQDNSMESFLSLKNSFENIINKSNVFAPDVIIIFTFINSIYYLVKFKINLWGYNQSIFYEKNNKIKPYFNINIKNKIINVGFNLNL